MNTNAMLAEEIIRIPCVGKTNFDRRVLILCEDHMVLKSDNGEVIFDELYRNVACLRKSEKKILENTMILVLKNGIEHKFSLDRLHTLKGRYTKYYNPAIKQLSQTLPAFVNKRSAEKKSSFLCKNCGAQTSNAKWCSDCKIVVTGKNIQTVFCKKCGKELIDVKFCSNCKKVIRYS